MGQTNGRRWAHGIRVHTQDAHAHTRAQQHAHKTLASYQPQHQAPAPSRPRLLSSPPLRLFSTGRSSRSESRTSDSVGKRSETRGREGDCVSSAVHFAVGSSEYAFRHFLAHSAFLSPVSTVSLVGPVPLGHIPSEVNAKYFDISGAV